MKATMATILEALDDRRLLKTLFGASWAPWRAFLAAVYGLPMSDAERALFVQCTGRQTPPTAPVKEATVIAGRRAGKSRIASLLAVWTAVGTDWTLHLAPGEVATVAVLAGDLDQCRACFRYIVGIIEAVPLLRRRIRHRTKLSIELQGRVIIEVRASSYKATRSYSYAAVIADELAYWDSEDSANPDIEVLNAVRPGLATLPGSLLVCISSPYARRGALWQAFHRDYGRENPDVLVWKAPTRTMNDTVPQSTIDSALERDPASAQAEWLAQFRSDVESFISAEVLAACVVPGRHELAPRGDVSYVGFCDPSGGSRDSFTLSIAHMEGDVVVVDCLRETKPPFDPDVVVAEYAALAKSYRLTALQADRYAGAWVPTAFLKHGIVVEQSADAKSVIYGNALPRLNAHTVQLLDHPRLTAQLLGLERKTARGGRDSIDHGPHAHDDCANAVCGAIVRAAGLAVGPCEIGASNLSRQPTYGTLFDFRELPSFDPGLDVFDRNRWP
jgi:hypothetical protein